MSTFDPLRTFIQTAWRAGKGSSPAGVTQFVQNEKRNAKRVWLGVPRWDCS